MDSTLSIAAPGTLAATERLQVPAENAADTNSGGRSPSAAFQQVAARYDSTTNVMVMRIYSQIMESLLDIET
jgi:flagellar basal body rod protein FlgC